MKKLRAKLTVLFLSVLIVLISTGSSLSQPSEPVSSVSTEELRQALTLIDTQTERIKLLELEVRTASRKAEIDSMLAARELEVTVESYEDIVAGYRKSRPSMLERLILRPELWLLAGVWLGTQASR